LTREEAHRRKIKSDAKRLIDHAMGRAQPKPERNVKSWLKKDPKAIAGFEEVFSGYDNLLEVEHAKRKNQQDALM